MKVIVVGILTAVLGLTAIEASANPYHHRHHGHGPRVIYRDNWMGPLIGGVVLGAVIADANKPTVIQQPPVIVQQPSVVLQQPVQTYCTEWKEIMNSDGTVYKERTCYQK